MYNLKCNNIKCQNILNELITYTRCGHVFCNTCGSNIHRLMRCIACNQLIHDNKDLMIRDSRDHPDMLFTPPNIVLDEARRAVNFWMFQINEELNIKTKKYNKLSELANLEIESLKNQINSKKIELKAINKKLMEVEKEVEREKKNYYEMESRCEEKMKEIQVLTSINSSMRSELRDRYNSSDK